ncbi:type II secretion system F family protein [Vreelandella rituensis]|uniref:Type II secretion system protein GspF domain-containing protein n=1 Tax=Vreelandella rituensis TaxID=2282306 RepID=A0A368UBM3_9GAMM|nr:type II secretion system F family protein [Halomonas rituensis]RCV93782.1 hypothetical protein DU506_01095 [Halomonas rituensis]
MREYCVKVMGEQGLSKRTVIASDSEQAAHLARHDGRVIRVYRPRGSKNLDKAKLTPRLRIEFLEKLAMMLASKVPLEEALETLGQVYSGAVRRVATTLNRELQSGMDFYEALRSLPDFPETTVALVEAGMRSGKFHEALSETVTFEKEMEQVKRVSSEGLWYALLNFGFGSTLIFCTSYIFAPYFMNSGFIATSEAIDIGWVVMLSNLMGGVIGVTLLSALGVWLVSHVLRPLNPGLSDRITLRIPLYRKIALNKKHYILFYTVSRLIGSGIRIDDALRVAMQTSPKGEMQKDLQRALTRIETDDGNWPDAMTHINAIDKAALATSQNRADIAVALREVANGKKEDYIRALRVVAPLLQVFGLFMMAMAGFLLFCFTALPSIQALEGLL